MKNKKPIFLALLLLFTTQPYAGATDTGTLKSCAAMLMGASAGLMVVTALMIAGKNNKPPLDEPLRPGLNLSSRSYVGKNRSLADIVAGAVIDFQSRESRPPLSLSEIQDLSIYDTWGNGFRLDLAKEGFDVRSSGEDEEFDTPDDLIYSYEWLK